MDNNIRFTVKTNLREIYEEEKKRGFIKKLKTLSTPEARVCFFIRRAIELKAKNELTDIEKEIAYSLFEKKKLDEGIQEYLTMFKEIKNLPALKKYKRKLRCLSSWMESLKNDEKLDLEADLELLDQAPKSKKLFNYFLDKYEAIDKFECSL